MRHIKRRILSFLLGLALLALLPQPACALSAEITNIKTDTWCTAAGHSYQKTTGTVYYFYRFKVPSGSYVRVDLKKKGQSQETGLYLSSKPDRSLKPAEYVCLREGESAVSRYVYLPKGTYYASAYEPIRFRIRIGQASNEKNYTVGRAVNLKAGKRIVVTQTPTGQYSRWYKIKVTRKHRLVMSSNNQYNIMLYDASYKRVSLVNQTGASDFKTAEKLPKGIYYVRIGRTDTPGRSSVTTFTWQ